MSNPNIITKYLIKRELSINDFKGYTKDTFEKALTQCDKVELDFIMDANYNKKHDLIFPPHDLGRVGLNFILKEGVTYFIYFPYTFIFYSVDIIKRTISGYCYRGLEDILQEDLYNSLQEQYLNFCEEYKFNVRKSLFMEGQYFKYKDFSLKYSYVDGDIIEHPIKESDIITANFAKVTKFDQNGFFYKPFNSGQESYIAYENLVF